MVQKIICLHLMDHAVLRVAAWPLETLDPFAAPNLAAEAAALDLAQQAVLNRRTTVSAALYNAVPLLSNHVARAYLLAVRRRVHGGVAPLPTAPDDVTAACAGVLGLSTLLKQECEAREALNNLTIAFAVHHDLELERQRLALYAAAGEQRFLRGLAIANPTVFLRWQREHDLPDEEVRHARRLETTVFHYLCRAAGRPTPNGAWAGVSTVTPRDGASGRFTVASVPARYLVTPNLVPFTILLRWLAAQPRYRRGNLFRLNPTFYEDDVSYCYERDDGSRPPHRERLPANAVTAAVARYFASGETWPIGPLLDTLAPATGAPAIRAKLRRAIDSLIDRDVLRVDLALPAAAPDAWSALESVVPRLSACDGTAWQRALIQMRSLCDDLGGAFDRLSANTVNDLRASIEQVVQALWSEYGLAGGPSGPAIFLDMAACFTGTWDAAQIAAAQEAIRLLCNFHAADGTAELYRLAALRDVAAACVDGVPMPLLPLVTALEPAHDDGPMQDSADDEGSRAYGTDTRRGIFNRFAADPALDAMLTAKDARWETLLEANHAAARETLSCPSVLPMPSPGFGGALLLPLAGATATWLGQGRPQPALFAGRFAPLFGEDAAGKALFAALHRASIDATATGINSLDVLGSDPVNPNAALRPRLTHATLDPHAPLPDGLHELSVQFDRQQRPWLYRAGVDGALLPLYNSGAAIGHWDRCSRLLLLLAMGHGWEFLSFGFPTLPAEAERWHHLPRLLLPGGAVLSPERWRLGGETKMGITTLRGTERYRAWRVWATRAGLPPLVYVRSESGTTGLLLQTDSPLAIRCLFDTAAARADMVFDELPGDPCDWPVRDAAGRCYVAELGITWHTRGYGMDAPRSMTSK